MLENSNICNLILGMSTGEFFFFLIKTKFRYVYLLYIHLCRLYTKTEETQISLNLKSNRLTNNSILQQKKRVISTYKRFKNVHSHK